MKKREALLHDLRAPLAKMKTALQLMKEASLEEIQSEYLPLLDAAAKEMEKELASLAELLASKGSPSDS